MDRGFGILTRFSRLVPLLAGGVLFLLLIFLIIYTRGHTVADFAPRGIIAMKERNLMFFALGLSVIVVVPVFILLFSFAWRYREQNAKATYSPDLGGSRVAETIWWLIPAVLIFILSVVAWNSSHALDPSKALVSIVKPLNVQVVSLDWKWLFIYPDRGVASVNALHVPINTPVNFSLTSDAPMNSFWIPQLGGQIYTMPGMTTQLHLMASQVGNYRGQSANISGTGFAGMTFVTQATSQTDFESWVRLAHQSSARLTQDTYNRLSRPSSYNKAMSYASVEPGLYQHIMDKYMTPTQSELASAERTP